MIELILSTLAEFGLIREDYKHRKRISKKEKEDGTKRPIGKYLLQPSSIILVTVLVVGSISAFLFFRYQRTSIFSERTKKEIAEMKIPTWAYIAGIFMVIFGAYEAWINLQIINDLRILKVYLKIG